MKKQKPQNKGEPRYSDYGLDTVKVSVEAGTRGAKRCLWCGQYQRFGYSLCFINWVICPGCVVRGLASNRLDMDIWRVDYCFKCPTRMGKGFQFIYEDKPVFMQPEGIRMQFGICEDHLREARLVLFNYVGLPAPPVPERYKLLPQTCDTTQALQVLGHAQRRVPGHGPESLAELLRKNLPVLPLRRLEVYTHHLLRHYRERIRERGAAAHQGLAPALPAAPLPVEVGGLLRVKVLVVRGQLTTLFIKKLISPKTIS